MKNILRCAVLLLSVFAVALTAEERPEMPGPDRKAPGELPPPPGPGRFPKRRPRSDKRPDLVFELIENSDFSPEQKARLKEMAAKDPRSAHQEMRRIIRERRSEWVKSVLALRERYRSESDPAKKAALEAQLKQKLNEEAERRFAMNRRMLDGMRKFIEERQKELQAMQSRYEERVKGKDQFVEEETKRILSDEGQEHLLRSIR